MPSRHRQIPRRLPTLVLCALLAVPLSLQAQRAPIFLEPNHWSYDAIRRLHTAGMAPPASDPSLAPVTLQHALRVFTFAADSANTSHHALLQHARAYAALLRADTVGVLAHTALQLGWLYADGEARAGDGYFPEEDWEGARPIERVHGPVASVRAFGWLHPRVGWSVDGGWIGDEARVHAASATAALGPFDFWVGRRRLNYGAGRGGAVVLGNGFAQPAEFAARTLAAIDGVGVHTRQPFHLPGFLRVLGPDRIELVAGRLARSGKIESPYFVFGRLTGSPFSRRITLGINRGAIFGGEGNPVTLRRLGGLLIGLHGGNEGEFENQVFAVVARYRPPLGVLPLELYYERGMDDTAGSFFDVPGQIFGFDVAALPGIPAASLGVEHTRFATSCCGNPIWYRSIFFRGSWADDGRLFAHPLGGQGKEWLLHSRVDLPAHGLLLRADAFTRNRGAENLFATERVGRSNGLALGLEYYSPAGFSLRFNGDVEDAARWVSRRAVLSIGYAF